MTARLRTLASYAIVSIASIAAGLYLFEIYLSTFEVSPYTAARRAGRAFDGRTRREVLEDARASGEPLITAGLEEVHRLQWQDGRPLAATSEPESARLLLCNEGGQWVTYRSDEYGFRNPPGLWVKGPVRVAIVGDSFAHGFCVPDGQTIPGLLRNEFPDLLSLGEAGSGPLRELMAVREYLPAVKPAIVVWLYFNNDFSDLEKEKSDPILPDYLWPDFRQNLMERHAELDQVIRKTVAVAETRGKKWSLPIDWRPLPLWAHDLVAGPGVTATSATIRLWRTRQRLTAGSQPPPPPDTAAFRKVLSLSREAVAVWGGRLVFVCLPGYADLGGGSPASVALRKAAITAAQDASLPVIDPLPAFDRVPGKDSLFFFPGSHYSEAGYALAAEVIRNELPTSAPTPARSR